MRYICKLMEHICKLMEHKPTILVKAYKLASYFITEIEAMHVMQKMRNPPIAENQSRAYF